MDSVTYVYIYLHLKFYVEIVKEMLVRILSLGCL